MNSKTENPKEKPTLREQIDAFRAKALRREKTHLPDDLRIGLINTSKELFSSLLSDLYSLEKMLTDEQKEEMFKKANLSFDNLKEEYSTYFERKALILHEVLQVYNGFATKPNLERMNITHHYDIAKALAVLTSPIKIHGKLQESYNRILKEGIESRVPKDHQEDVKRAYQEYFPNMKF